MNFITDIIRHITIEEVEIQEIDLGMSFDDVADRFSDIPGTVILLSGGDLDCSRYHILGTYPWLILSGRHHRLNVQMDGKKWQLRANPFEQVSDIIRFFRWYSPKPSLPFVVGLMGYFAYDLKDLIENLPRTSIDDLNLPHIWLSIPSVILIQDKLEKKTWQCVPKRYASGKAIYNEYLSFFQQKMLENRPKDQSFFGNPDGFQSNFSKHDYKNAINRIIEYIRNGDVYQVNMSQRFMTDFSGNPYGLFQELFRVNPAPFFAYIHAQDHVIISTSPERFICQNDRHVETRPIKGTRPRGKTPEQDKKLAQELYTSKKDDSELSMIVDLLRNDLGKVCDGGSVRVREHKRLEAYQNVYHLISIVEGTLAEGRDSIDLIQATFPGGSITGCPKIRAMEIIDELEPNRRHIYTGSIGYLSFHDTMDLSIAIRTATIVNNKIIFSVGGGIVYDSNPEDEYHETLHKGKTLLEVLKGANRIKPEPMSYCWINGVIKPINQANIPLESPGFQYGCGCFETIRVDNGVPLYLDRHLIRLNRAWRTIISDQFPDLTWQDIIRLVIEKNNLLHCPSVVKIIAAKGTQDKAPFTDMIAVLARPYIDRLKGKQDAGIHLHTYPHSRQIHLADHKTLNYLYYFLAGKWAKENKADEALILNPDGSVSETNSANILLIDGRTVIIPTSMYVLPGIMQEMVCEFLEATGYQITQHTIYPKDFFSKDYVLMTNSLIGALPVLSLDGKALNPPGELWKSINQAVLKVKGHE